MGPLRHLWIKWKMLKLPWRSTFLIGQDLQGNTFWEFKDAMNANRFRRIVRYNRTPHLADVRISPQWHQWLRRTRYEPPTIQEQQADVGRQAQLKFLARQADERWESKASFLDRPKEQKPEPATLPKDPGGYAPQTEPEEKAGVRSAVDSPAGDPAPSKHTEKPDPWKGAQSSGPSKQWQPDTWTPASTGKRR